MRVHVDNRIPAGICGQAGLLDPVYIGGQAGLFEQAACLQEQFGLGAQFFVLLVQVALNSWAGIAGWIFGKRLIMETVDLGLQDYFGAQIY